MSLFLQTDARLRELTELKSTLLFWKMCVHAGVMIDVVRVSQAGLTTRSYKVDRGGNGDNMTGHEEPTFTGLLRSCAEAQGLDGVMVKQALLCVAMDELARVINYHEAVLDLAGDIPF